VNVGAWNTYRSASFSRYARYSAGSVDSRYFSFVACFSVRFSGFFYEQRVVMRSGGMAALVVWLREGRRCA
jgi:hypothetical protein